MVHGVQHGRRGQGRPGSCCGKQGRKHRPAEKGEKREEHPEKRIRSCPGVGKDHGRGNSNAGQHDAQSKAAPPGGGKAPGCEAGHEDGIDEGYAVIDYAVGVLIEHDHDEHNGHADQAGGIDHESSGEMGHSVAPPHVPENDGAEDNDDGRQSRPSPDQAVHYRSLPEGRQGDVLPVGPGLKVSVPIDCVQEGRNDTAEVIKLGLFEIGTEFLR